MKTPRFFPADAHEGPVWVADQRRLFFTTDPHLDGRRRVDIQVMDFSPYPDLAALPATEITAATWWEDINMANAMTLSCDNSCLLVAEQGYGEERPGGISRIDIVDGARRPLITGYGDRPFNSPNKVIESRGGHVIFSDPDYGFRQGFKPPARLEPNVYVLTAAGEITCFRCGLEMPHGLALSSDERTLFVTDTSNDGAHAEDIQLNRRRSVWKFAFDPAAGRISGPGRFCFQVSQGVPDGMTVTGDRLLVGGGDGVYVADHAGDLLGIIPTERTAVNVTTAAAGRHLFVTANAGVYLFPDWREHVRS